MPHDLLHALQSPSTHLHSCVLQFCCVAGAAAAQLIAATLLLVAVPKPSVHWMVRVCVPVCVALEHCALHELQEPLDQAHACALQLWVRSVGAAASQ